VVNGGRL